MSEVGENPAMVAIEQCAEAWLLLLRSGNATLEDAQAFRRWCAENPAHACAAKELRRVWNVASAAATVVAQQETALSRPWTGPAVRSPARRAFVGTAVAAGAAWLAFRPPLQLWPALGELTADYRTGTGEQRQVMLADHVVIEMNTQTRFNLRPADTTRGGIELLAGEAEAAAGMSSAGPLRSIDPFIVVAGNGRLQTSSARFNVRRTDDEVCVTCITGSVAFEHPRQRLMLSASQELIYTDRDVSPVSNIDAAAVTAWRRGLLLFNDVPLAQVVDEINRYRPGKIILRNAQLGKSRVRARFSIRQLDDAIMLIHAEYGAHVTELPGSIVLLS
ncbi:FecR domain-containing protein [Paraburkholderia sp.]|uniref:FecR family protein n=1 Tax=Paraburkholderia sp. TaxID=1926495 RepID=UPI00261E4CAB|nr:FecR domain-containing protein [Paraburkholderia sp.]